VTVHHVFFRVRQFTKRPVLKRDMSQVARVVGYITVVYIGHWKVPASGTQRCRNGHGNLSEINMIL
jgi:hypothetical protein